MIVWMRTERRYWTRTVRIADGVGVASEMDWDVDGAGLEESCKRWP